MMHADQQHVILFGLPDQTPPDRRASLQVERCTGLFGYQPVEFFRCLLAFPKVMLSEVKLTVVLANNPLHWVPIDQPENGT